MNEEISPEASAGIGARLDRMPITSFHHGLALIIGAGLVVDGVDIAVGAGLAGALLREGFADLEGVGWLASATALGLAGGGLATGFLADRFGRLRMMRITIAVIAAAGLACALSQSLTELIVWRFVAALALGGETVLAYGMLTEFMPERTRGRWMTWVALIASLGLPLSLGLGFFILPAPEGWRWLIALPAIAALAIFALRLLLSESPRWLEARGKDAAALAIVARIEASAKGAVALTAAKAPAPARAQPAGFAQRLGLAVIINLAALAGVYGFINWLPAFFVAEGADIAASSFFSALMTAGAPVGTILAFAITDRVERRWAVAISALAAALAGVVYAQAESPAMVAALGFVTVVALYTSATLGMINYAPELFPTGARLRAIGAASATGRAFAVALPLIVVPLFSAWGQAGVISLIVAFLVLEAAALTFFGVNTRGRALENI